MIGARARVAEAEHPARWYPRPVRSYAIVALVVVASASWGCSGGEAQTGRTAAVEPTLDAAPGPAVPAAEPPQAPAGASTPVAAPAAPDAPAPDAPAPDAPAPDAPAPDAPAIVDVDPTPVGEAPRAVAEPLGASVETEVDLPGGRTLRVAAEEGAEQSMVWARPTSPAGPTVVLRKTSGAVDAIEAAFDGRTLWIAWRSHIEGKKSMAALAGFDPDLRLTHAPRILRTFDHDGSPMQDVLRMTPRPGTGAGVTVAALVGTAPCRGLFSHEVEEGPASCQRLQIDVVDPDGTTVRSAFRMLDGGDGGLTDLLDVGSGVASAFFVWHGGPLVDVAFVPYAATEPVRALGSCGYPPVELVWADGALVMLCPDPSGEGDACRGRAAAPCGTLRRTSLDGTPVAPDVGHEVRFHRVTETCDGSTPVVRVSWVADPAQPAIAAGHLDLPRGSTWALDRPGPGPTCSGPAAR